MKATYQTRIADYAGVNRSAGDAALSACAELYGQVQRKLFAEMAAGRSAVSLKSTYLERYGIPARMFNAVRVSLQGKAVSVRKGQKLQADSLRRRISRAEKQIVQAEQRGRLEQVHHKRRRLVNLERRLARLEADLLQQGGFAFASGRRSYGASSTTLKSTATAAMKSGSRTGVVPAAASSSCWGAGMRQRAVSCAWPASRMMGR